MQPSEKNPPPPAAPSASVFRYPNLLEWVLLLLLAVLSALPFLPQSHDTLPPFLLRLQVEAESPGLLSLPASGQTLPFPGNHQPRSLEFQLPAAQLPELALHLDCGSGRVQLTSATVLNPGASPRHLFRAEEFISPSESLHLDQLDEGIQIDFADNNHSADLLLRPAAPLWLHTPPITQFWWLLRQSFLHFVGFGALFWLALQARHLRASSPAGWRRFLSLPDSPPAALLLVTGLAVLAARLPLLLPGHAFFFHAPNALPDSLVHSFSVTANTHRALLLENTLPLWNRLEGCGSALLGQGDSLLGDPLQLLLPVVFNNHPWSWTLSLLLHDWLFCAGLALLLWQLTRHRIAALLSGFAAAFTGLLLHHLDDPASWFIAYAPWFLLCWLQLGRASTPRARLRWAALLSLATFILLTAGRLEEGLTLSLGLSLFGLLLLRHPPVETPAAASRQVLFAALWALLSAGLLAAPFWTSHLATLERSLPAITPPPSLSPAFLLALGDPLFSPLAGSPLRLLLPSLNLLLLLGLLQSLARSLKGQSISLERDWLLASIPAFILAFNLLPPSWYQALGLSLLFGPSSGGPLLLLSVQACLLGGLGLIRLFKELRAADSCRVLLPGLSLLGLLFLLFVSSLHAQGAELDRFQYGHLAGSLIALLILAWLLNRPASLLSTRSETLASTGPAKLPSHSHQAAGFLLALGSLGFLVWHLALQSEAGFESHLLQARESTPLHRHVAKLAGNLQLQGSYGPCRILNVNTELPSALADARGLETLQTTAPWRNPYLTDLLRSLSLQSASSAPASAPAPKGREADLLLKAQVPALRFLNAGHVVTSSADHWTCLLAASAQEPEAVVPGGTPESPALLNIRNPWPRAFLVSELSHYTSTTELASRIQTATGPFACVQQGQTDLPAGLLTRFNAKPGEQKPAREASHYALEANSTRFEVLAEAPSVLVLNEAWIDREFRAFVDGRKVPYFRVNHVFKGLVIETPGRHTVEFRYVPRNWTQGCLLAGAGLLLLAAGLLWSFRPQASLTDSTKFR